MNMVQSAIQNERLLKENRYPGRGIIIGMTSDGRNYVQIYWIMGRSANSRNRVFKDEGGSVRTKAFDESKMEDPSLIIYYPIKALYDFHIVSNGDQTDTIYKFIENGGTFEAALYTREFEPDPPNYTPRISGYIDLRSERPNYGLSILKSIYRDQGYCQRSYFFYDHFIKGYGHCIHTYMEDGSPIPSFIGEPYLVRLYDNIEDNAEHFWGLMNEENKVSLLVKHIDRVDKKSRIKLINKNLDK